MTCTTGWTSHDVVCMSSAVPVLKIMPSSNFYTYSDSSFCMFENPIGTLISVFRTQPLRPSSVLFNNLVLLQHFKSTLQTYCQFNPLQYLKFSVWCFSESACLNSSIKLHVLSITHTEVIEEQPLLPLAEHLKKTLPFGGWLHRMIFRSSTAQTYGLWKSMNPHQLSLLRPQEAPQEDARGCHWRPRNA